MDAASRKFAELEKRETALGEREAAAEHAEAAARERAAELEEREAAAGVREASVTGAPAWWAVGGRSVVAAVCRAGTVRLHATCKGRAATAAVLPHAQSKQTLHLLATLLQSGSGSCGRGRRSSRAAAPRWTSRWAAAPACTCRSKALLG